MELGSDFHISFEDIEQVSDNINSYLAEFNTLYLDSGRNAIKVALQFIPIGEVLLPEYICESVIHTFENYQIKYYKINDDFSIDIDDLKTQLTENTKLVFLMHYFGALQSESTLNEIKKLKQEREFFVIEDTTHSIFTKAQTIGDYCVCSLRKWLPIPDGGVLYSLNSLECINKENISRNKNITKIYAMLLKKMYLENNMDFNEIYRSIFIESENALNKKNEIEQISSISEFLLSCYSIKDMLNKRKANYTYLSKHFINLGFDTPALFSKNQYLFAIPIYCDKRDILRDFLSKNRIYCAIHWPVNEEETGSRSKNISNKIMSLPIDQRYNIEHMRYLLEELKQYKEIYL